MSVRQKVPEDLTAKKALALEVIDRLKKEYPDAGCTLDYAHAWQLLVSVRLAAQCTDARVNIVVEDLQVSQCSRTGCRRTGGHRSHCETLRPWALQSAGYLRLYADAAGQIRLSGPRHF